jgi:hypothetical protein
MATKSFLDRDENMKKVVLFAFNGETMCFIHVLLNGLDMKANGYDIKIVIEGDGYKGRR